MGLQRHQRMGAEPTMKIPSNIKRLCCRCVISSLRTIRYTGVSATAAALKTLSETSAVARWIL